MGELADAHGRQNQRIAGLRLDQAARDRERQRRSQQNLAEFIDEMKGRPQIPYFETDALRRRPAALLGMGWVAIQYHSGAADSGGQFVFPETRQVRYCSHILRSTGMVPGIEQGTIYVTNSYADNGQGTDLVEYPFGTDQEVEALAYSMRMLSETPLEVLASVDGYPKENPYRF